MPPTNLFGLGYGVGPAGYGYPSVGSWSPSSLGSALAAWYSADVGCYTDAACLFAAASLQGLTTASADLNVGAGDASWAGWVYLTDVGTSRTVASKDEVPNNRGWIIHYLTGVGFSCRGSNDGTATVTVSDPNVRSAGVWYFVEAKYTRSTKKMGIAVNGGAFTESAALATAGIFASTFAMKIGSASTAATAMNGAVGRFAMWQRLLTAAERTWLYNAGAGRFYADLGVAGTDGSGIKTSLVEYWNLCESSSTRVGSHAGLDLTAVNTPTVAAGPGEGLCVNNAPRKRIQDASGNARHRDQATIGKQPLYLAAIQNGLAVGRYDGVDDFDQVLANLGAQPLTIFGAIKTANADGQAQWDGADVSNRCHLVRGTYVVSAAQEAFAGSVGIGALHAAGAFHVYEVTYDGASSEILIDGASLAIGQVGAQGLASGFTVGGRYDGALSAVMDEGETFIVVGAMTAAQKASARAYLRARWNTP